MGKGRLEAFSDGVLAIIITIMVLELRPPHATDLSALRPLTPVLLSLAIKDNPAAPMQYMAAMAVLGIGLGAYVWMRQPRAFVN